MPHLTMPHFARMSGLLAAATLLALSPLGGPVARADGDQCPAVFETTWPGGLIARGSSAGDCSTARLALQVRTVDDEVVWSDVLPAHDLLVFEWVKTGQDMDNALRDWLTVNVTHDTTASLPEWRAGAEAPEGEEFPFVPDESLDQEAYAALRARSLPLICYVQGMESLTCLTREGADTPLRRIGIQMFPG